MTAPRRPATVSRGMSNRGRAEDGYTVLSYILAGPLLYGGLGWLGDHFLRTGFLLPLGFMLGVVLSLYVVIKRFGGNDAIVPTAAERKSSAGEEPQ